MTIAVRVICNVCGADAQDDGARLGVDAAEKDAEARGWLVWRFAGGAEEHAHICPRCVAYCARFLNVDAEVRRLEGSLLRVNAAKTLDEVRACVRESFAESPSTHANAERCDECRGTGRGALSGLPCATCAGSGKAATVTRAVGGE